MAKLLPWINLIQILNTNNRRKIKGEPKKGEVIQGETPKRRVRRKRTDNQPNLKQAESERESISNLELNKIDTNSQGTKIFDNSIDKMIQNIPKTETEEESE